MEFRVSGDLRGRQTRGYATYAAGNPLYPRTDKTDFEHLFTDHSLLHTIKNMENPLQKNLGDSFNMNSCHLNLPGEVTSEVPLHDHTKNEIPQPQRPADSGWRADIFPAFFGITNMIAGFFNHITGAVTLQHGRTVHPDKANTPSEMYMPSDPVDMHRKVPGFEEWSCDEPDASPPIDDAIRHFSPRDCSKNNVEASGDTVRVWLAQCETRGDVAGAAARDAMPLPSLADPAGTCQAKMAKIQDLLAGKGPETRTSVKPFKRYRPKKIFIDPKFVQEDTVESFTPEQLGRLQSVDTTDFVNPGVIARSELTPVETLPRVKLESLSPAVVNESTVVNEVRNEIVFEKRDSEPAAETDSARRQTDVTHSSVAEIKFAKDEIKDKSGIAVVERPAAESSVVENKHGMREDTKVTAERACDLRATCGDNATTQDVPECKRELISSCEDKLSRLKALLSERKKSRGTQKVTKTTASDSNRKCDESVPTSTEPLQTAALSKPIDCSANELADPEKRQIVSQKQDDDVVAIDKRQNTDDKKQKEIRNEKESEAQNGDSENSLGEGIGSTQNERNPGRAIPVPSCRPHRQNPNRLEVRKKRKQLRSHEDDTNESDFPSSVENSPKITVTPPAGFDETRGRFESNSSSDDSFVIVFSDSPPRSPRDLGASDTSEDSFIVFDGEADVSTNGCFTAEDSTTDESDSDESGSNLASAGRFSRTVADLTDARLYDEGWQVDVNSDSDEVDEDEKPRCSGVLLTDEKKRARRGQPEKRVRFSEKPPSVRVMRVWAFAAKQARAGNWRQHAADEERFRRRIADVDMAISWVLKPQHRNRVKFQRFMPWWHQQRRREQAERRAEEERRKAEDERRRAEEIERIEEEKRIEEEVKAELARERKNRKKMTSQEFAKNMSLYLAKIKPNKPHQQLHQVYHKLRQQTKTDMEKHINGVTEVEVAEECVTKTVAVNENFTCVNVPLVSELNMDTTAKPIENVFDANINKNGNHLTEEILTEESELGKDTVDVTVNRNVSDVKVINNNFTDVNLINKTAIDLNVINKIATDVNVINKSDTDINVTKNIGNDVNVINKNDTVVNVINKTVTDINVINNNGNDINVTNKIVNDVKAIDLNLTDVNAQNKNISDVNVLNAYVNGLTECITQK